MMGLDVQNKKKRLANLIIGEEKKLKIQYKPETNYQREARKVVELDIRLYWDRIIILVDQVLIVKFELEI